MTGHKSMSLSEELESFPRGAQELSAARLARDVDGLIHRALKTRSIKQGELAEKLGVGESAVSQVLNGEGNIRISTLGRYLRALGYEAKLHLVPVEKDAPAIEAPQRSRRQPRVNPPTQVVTVAPQVSTPTEGRWTVLDMDTSHVFVTDVQLRDSSATGALHFSGTLPTPVVRVNAPVKAASRAATSR